MGGGDRDVSLKEIGWLCDILYIGGRKVGGLFGEGVVIGEGGVIGEFDRIVKEGGVLVGKGGVLGLEFDRLFRDGL